MGLKKKISRYKLDFKDWLNATWYRYRSDLRSVDLPVTGDECAERLCILAHYSHDGLFDEYLFHYVDALQKARCEILVVSSSPCFQQTDKVKLLKMGIGVVHRHNVGYDFGSWFAGVKLVAARRNLYQTIIFANDSVYGPFSDLGAIIDKMDARHLDVWAMTTSAERRPHFQTYFWAVSNQGLRGDFFDRFWFSYYRYYSQRQRVIDRYELQLKEIAEIQYGLVTGAYVDHADLPADVVGAATRPDKMNPVQHGALYLIRECEFPFVKRELLLSDPLAISVSDKIGEVLATKNAVIWASAKRHLGKLTRPN